MLLKNDKHYDISEENDERIVEPSHFIQSKTNANVATEFVKTLNTSYMLDDITYDLNSINDLEILNDKISIKIAENNDIL